MKVKFCCDSGANIHSEWNDTLDTVKDLGLEDGEWEAMTEDQKQTECEEFVFGAGKMQIWYEELEDE